MDGWLGRKNTKTEGTNTKTEETRKKGNEWLGRQAGSSAGEKDQKSRKRSEVTHETHRPLLYTSIHTYMAVLDSIVTHKSREFDTKNRKTCALPVRILEWVLNLKVKSENEIWNLKIKFERGVSDADRGHFVSMSCDFGRGIHGCLWRWWWWWWWSQHE